MLVIQNENTKFFDVDGCLILSKTDTDPKGSEYIAIQDPVHPKYTITMRVHKPNVRCLREEIQRGAHVTVWSRSGWEWARNVVQALGLGETDVTVMSKPLAYFDDMPVEQWLKDRIYLDPNTPYKE